jgi:eukaryotic-like serine/threonine-protein kinase
MPAPATTDEFVDLVRKSGVVDDTKFTNYLKQPASNPLPADINKYAGQLVRDAILTHFQAEQILQGKWKRFTIGKYKVLEKIGVGGMGQVFLCEHKLMRRRVAVKVLPPQKGADEASRERFYREARAVAALDHPNIVRAFDIDADDNLHFLVMEYVDGVNLQDLVKKHVVDGKCTFDPVRSSHYIYGAAAGLQYALETHIVHRDVKPGNILVDRSGCVKLLDMGLARIFNEEDDSITKKYDENVLGTADYLAPEQAVDSHSVDIRADLYSLGGTMYYLLTGHPPYQEGSVAQKLLWHQTRDPKPILSLRPDAPEKLVRIAEKLLKKSPADRYQTPAELMVDLQEWVQTPIAPPTDQELPQLSPAAMGPSPRPTTASGYSMSLTNSGEIPKVGSKPGYATPMLTPQPLPANAAVLSTADAITAPPAGNVWSDLAHDTSPDKSEITNPTVAPQSSLKQVGRGRPDAVSVAKPEMSRRKLIGLAAGLLAGCAALAFGVYSVFVKPSKPPQEQAAAEIVKTFYISRKPGDHEGKAPIFKSIRDALAMMEKKADYDEAKRKEPVTIVLLDAEHHEDASLPQFQGRFHSVCIEAVDPSQPVVWTAPRGSRSKSVVEIKAATNLKIRGVIFDGGGYMDYGLLIWGNQPGLQLENIGVRSILKSGIRLETVSGGESPAKFDRIRVSSEKLTESAVHFAAPPNIDPVKAKPHTNVQFQNCRFEGSFQKAAVVVGTSTKDVGFVSNRFHNMDRAILFENPGNVPLDIHLNVESNTFHTIKEAAIHAPMEVLAASSTLTVSRNYFAQTKSIAGGKVPQLANFKTPDNARDEQTGDANLKAKAHLVAGFKLPDVNPANDATYLRYPKSAPLASVGPGKVSVGVPQE